MLLSRKNWHVVGEDRPVRLILILQSKRSNQIETKLRISSRLFGHGRSRKMSEDNGTPPVALATTPEQPPQPPQGLQLHMQITPQGVVLTFPVNLALDNATMGQLVSAYLQAHPELVQEITKQTLAQKQQELAIIRHVNLTKNN